MRTTIENLYKNANYTQSEFVMLVGYSFIVAFLLSFTGWGANGVYDRSIGLQNLLLHFIISLFVIFIFTYIQKIVSVFVGIRVSHDVSWIFLLASILLCFVTRGNVIIFIPPSLLIHSQERLQIGRKPFGLTIKNLRVFALVPIVVLVLIAVFFSEVVPLTHQISSAFFWTCFLTALYSLIPIEFIVNLFLLPARSKLPENVNTRGTSLGSILFYGSRMNLIFALGFIVCSLISLVITGFWFVTIFAFLITFFITAIYFVKVEL